MTTIDDIEKKYMKSDVPDDLRVGDSVAVGLRIREGDKERIQHFHGTIIAKRRSGIQARITVRRIVAGEGVEMTVPLHSPRVAGVDVERRGKVRRAKLYYLPRPGGQGHSHPGGPESWQGGPGKSGTGTCRRSREDRRAPRRGHRTIHRTGQRLIPDDLRAPRRPVG